MKGRKLAFMLVLFAVAVFAAGLLMYRGHRQESQGPPVVPNGPGPAVPAQGEKAERRFAQFISNYGPLVNARFGGSVKLPQGYGFARWFYWDVDGDNQLERIVRLARIDTETAYTGTEAWPVSSPSSPVDNGVDPGQGIWDDGQPWQVYIEEQTGEITHVFADYVQLTQPAFVLRTAEPRLTIVLPREGLTRILDCSYKGPGRFTSKEVNAIAPGITIGHLDD